LIYLKKTLSLCKIEFFHRKKDPFTIHVHTLNTLAIIPMQSSNESYPSCLEQCSIDSKSIIEWSDDRLSENISVLTGQGFHSDDIVSNSSVETVPYTVISTPRYRELPYSLDLFSCRRRFEMNSTMKEIVKRTSFKNRWLVTKDWTPISFQDGQKGWKGLIGIALVYFQSCVRLEFASDCHDDVCMTFPYNAVWPVSQHWHTCGCCRELFMVTFDENCSKSGWIGSATKTTRKMVHLEFSDGSLGSFCLRHVTRVTGGWWLCTRDIFLVRRGKLRVPAEMELPSEPQCEVHKCK